MIRGIERLTGNFLYSLNSWRGLAYRRESLLFNSFVLHRLHRVQAHKVWFNIQGSTSFRSLNFEPGTLNLAFQLFAAVLRVCLDRIEDAGVSRATAQISVQANFSFF